MNLKAPHGAVGDHLARRPNWWEFSRGQLQQQVQAGELELNDGLVSTDRLLSLYPDASGGVRHAGEGGSHPRRVVGRRLRERVLPSQEVLSQRLFRQTQELADVQRTLQQYHRLVLALRDRTAPS